MLLPFTDSCGQMSRIILYLISVIIILGPSHLTNANNNIAYNIPDPGTAHTAILLPFANGSFV